MNDLTKLAVWLVVIVISILCQDRNDKEIEDSMEPSIEWNTEIEQRLMREAAK